MSHTCKIAFDIETVADNVKPELLANLISRIEVAGTKPETVAKNKEAAILDLKNSLGLSPMTGRIAAICMYGIDSTAKPIDIRIIDLDEKKILTKFWDEAYRLSVASHGDIQWISYNGKQFDVWFIRIRSALLGVNPRIHLDQRRFDTQKHFDVREVCTNFGSHNKGKMDDWAIVFDAPRKVSEGSHVQQMWDQKKFTEITDYCFGDCVTTFRLQEKLDPFF